MLGEWGRGALDLARGRRLLAGSLACAALLMPQPAGAADGPATHVVNARTTQWEVREVTAVAGDSVEWRWQAGFHDLWLVDADVPLGEEAAHEQQLRDITPDGAAPLTRAFPEPGAWDFYCKVHNGRGTEPDDMSGTITVAPRPPDDVAPVTTATLDPATPAADGVYDGPVTVTLSATDTGGSGVDRIQYRLLGGPLQDYAGPFTVSAPGSHSVSFASIDREGNAEPWGRVVEFVIGRPVSPVPPPPPPEPSPPSPPPAGSGDPPPPPAQAATAELSALPARLAAARLGRGLRVRGACVAAATGTLRLTITRRDARRLELPRTLARAAVMCRGGTFSVRLRPARRARKALSRLRGAVAATLALALGGGAGSARDTATLRIHGRKAARR
jgi:plastocyanin